MGDGKSTLAANLAVSIAQSGKRTVLIDADFRRPRLHKFFPSVNRAVGLSSVIAGQARPEEAIQPTAVANLSLLPCGPRPSNPAELLTSPRFQEFLAAIRPQFDFVLLDTPPVLLVSDPCAVAPRVDGVLLVLRLGKNNRPTAERACEVLASLGAKVLGVMVNDKSARSGAGYGYSAGYGYRYDYRYSYQYGYGYQPAYGETDDESRPARPPAEPPAANGYHGGEAVND
jgi:capsular exopolysaccharide synthesis family protein